MRKPLTIILLLIILAVNRTYGQVDSVEIMPAEQPTFRWYSATEDGLLNFNNAQVIDGGTHLVFDSLPYAKDYTLVVVYKSLDSAESGVWRLEYTDSLATSTRGLTTERIVSDSIFIRYAEQTSLFPIITTLRQSAPDSTAPYVRLVMGGDALQGQLKIAELMYFDKRLGNSMLRRVQSALAVKYGVTLGPVDYVDGNGNTIWEYADSGYWHHRVTGIGRDSTYGLYQWHSHSEMAEAMLTVATDTIEGQAFLIVGDNNAPLYFEQEDGDIEILARRWRIQGTHIDDNDFTFTFDTHNLPMPTDSLVLLAGDYIILPTTTTPNEVCFTNVWLPADTCALMLARGAVLWQIAQSHTYGAKGGNGHNDGAVSKKSKYSIQNTTFSIYPNPTSGHFNIEVTGAKQVQVTIYNVHGVVVATYSDSEKGYYAFEGSLPSGNVYYATITTESGSQTMKLVVK